MLYNIIEMSLELCKKSRKFVRSNVTKAYNELSNLPRLDLVTRKSWLAKLKGYYSDLNHYDDKIIELSYSEADEETLNSELQACQNYKDKINECMAVIESCTNITTPTVNERNVRSLLKSPVAPLPKFASSEGEDLERFLCNFESTVSLFSYTDYDRLLLLKQQVSGKALFLIDSLDSDKQTYSDAKVLLLKAFASVPIQKSGVVKMMTELKLSCDSEPYEYMSKMRKIQQSIKRLQMTSDDFMQYFFFNGLNDNFKYQLIQVTNKSNPPLAEIVDKFFEATERYELSNNSKYKVESREKSVVEESKNMTVSLATKVHIDSKFNPFKFCTCCSDLANSIDHPIHKCNKYNSPSERIEKLLSLKACTKCASLQHDTNSCRFRFRKRCTNCSDWHFSFLCPDGNAKPADVGKIDVPDTGAKPKFKPKNNSSMTNKTVHSGVACLSSVKGDRRDEGSCNSILSTFTCAVDDEHFRALRDSGSQVNFVAEDLLNKINYKVIVPKIDLSVTGINETKKYSTKSVSFTINLASRKYHIEALVLPKINIDLEIPKLPLIARKIMERGFSLADKDLLTNNGIISDVKLILGANSAHCFLDKNVFFGSNNLSMFSLTPFGAMLIGDVRQLLNDLPSLPKLAKIPASSKKLNVPKNRIKCATASLVQHKKSNISVLNDDGAVDDEKLCKAADEILDIMS